MTCYCYFKKAHSMPYLLVNPQLISISAPGKQRLAGRGRYEVDFELPTSVKLDSMLPPVRWIISGSAEELITVGLSAKLQSEHVGSQHTRKAACSLRIARIVESSCLRRIDQVSEGLPLDHCLANQSLRTPLRDGNMLCNLSQQ